MKRSQTDWLVRVGSLADVLFVLLGANLIVGLAVRPFLPPELVRTFYDPEVWAKLLAAGAPSEAWPTLRPAAESATAIILSTLREEVLFEARTPMGPKRDQVWSTLIEQLAVMVSRHLESAAASA